MWGILMNKSTRIVSWLLSGLILFWILEFYFASFFSYWRILPSVLFAWPILLFNIYCALHIPDASSRFYRWFSLTVPVLLAIILTLPTAQVLLTKQEKLLTTTSPNEAYTVNVYKKTNPTVLVAERKGPLWFKQHLHVEPHFDHLVVQWITNNQLQINQHVIDLRKAGHLK
ncbi:hypothetical protein SAMN05720591_11926 [Halolactibacillus alkaliphilus]|nr:hypothetical protein SAMN05720591_11926 [Halolactibacillus alkaliphilus]